MFDTKKHALRLARAKAGYDQRAEVLVEYASNELLDRLFAVQRNFQTGVAAFARTSVLAAAMRQHPQIESVIRLEEVFHVGQTDRVSTLDALNLKPASVDLVLAPLGLHWSNDLPGTLVQIARALRPDGLFMAALPGPLTLQELRECLLEAEAETTGGAARRVDPFAEVRDAGGLLQRAGFALPVSDQETLTLRYDGLEGLIKDLRAFGATSRLSAPAPTINRKTWESAKQLYRERFSDPDGRVRATFQIIWLSAWSPHESQQKPLKPGSAKQRLADALGTSETKL
ncbi:MAG: methyltransferase domain-containing protein [Pseudomonadota bacterium]